MSNYNTTDMVEDDAADLKFPKDCSSHNSVNNQDIEMKVIEEKIFTTDPVCCSCKSPLVEPFVKCYQCENITLCPSCFSNGFEINDHENNHDYVIVRYNYPIIDDNWTAKEELELLDVLQECGFGNWKDIENRIQNKSAIECKNHYMKNYIDAQKSVEFPKMQEADSTIFGSKPVPFIFKLQDLEEPPRYPTKSLNSRHFAGYNAARSDFETNHDNHAELLISNLKYNDFVDDNNEDIELFKSYQSTIVDAYNNRLRERERRKKIVRKHGLISVRKTCVWLRRYDTTITPSVAERLVTFMQLVDGIEFDFIMEGLHRAGELRNNLGKLFEFRANGIQHLHSIKMFNKLSKINFEKSKDRRMYMTQANTNLKHIITASNNSDNGGNLPFMVRKPPPPLEIRGHIGYEKLTTPEKSLCSNIRIPPEDFLHYKNMLITENKKYGSLKLSQARPLLRIDVNKTRKIYDFFVKEGHINQPSN